MDCVSIDGHSITWNDVVKEHQKHYFLLGGGSTGWPVEPPNYMAFRYCECLNSVHHIESYEVIDDDWQNIFSLQCSNPLDRPHYLYTLGESVSIKGDT